MNKTLTEQNYQDAAANEGLPVAAIKAIAEVEAPRGGFDVNGLPVILFEGHWFSHFTNGAFDKSHPTISYPKWTKRFYATNNTGEHLRLSAAASLDRESALLSASWGKFQIMGFNHASAGFESTQDFINAMYESEAEHLKAFLNFLRQDRRGDGMILLKRGISTGDWKFFADFYNGSESDVNHYAERLAKAFEENS